MTRQRTARRRLELAGRVTGADPAVRSITGTLLLYDTPVELGAWGEVFEIAPGAVAGTRPSGVKMLVQHDHDRPVGVAARLSDSDRDLRVTFRVAPTPAGDLALVEAAEGVRDGLSMGAYVVDSDTVRKHGRTVERVTRLDLYEGSLVTFPAFDAARVTEVNGRTPA